MKLKQWPVQVKFLQRYLQMPQKEGETRHKEEENNKKHSLLKSLD